MAVADEDATKPTEEQLELYRKSHAAFERGDYSLATDHLRTALEQGELNILHLSLGRTLFRAGRCEQAARHYEQVSDAPFVAEPPRDAVRTRLRRYRTELKRQCPGTLQVECRPTEITLRVDGGEARPCASGPFELSPGSHRVVASLDGRRTTHRVRIRALEEHTLVVDHPPATPPPAREAAKGAGEGARAEPKEGQRKSGRMARWGWGNLAAGVAILGGTVLVDTVWLDREIERFWQATSDRNADPLARKQRVERLQIVGLTGYVFGAALSATGLTLLSLRWARDSARAPEPISIRATVTPPGVSVSGHF